jgi:hypothetical protein
MNTLEYKNALLEELEDGAYKVREKRDDRTVIIYDLFPKEYFRAAWRTTESDYNAKARARDETQCVVLRTKSEEDALRFSAYFTRFIKPVATAIHWDGETISFYIGHVKSWGLEETMIKVRQIPARSRDYVGDIPLFADDITLAHQKLLALPKPKKDKVLYLNINGVLIMHPPIAERSENWSKAYPSGEPAPGVREFLEWAVENFEVRWLSDRTLMGTLPHHQAAELSALFGIKNDLLTTITNPNRCTISDMTQGIDFEDPRPWKYMTNKCVFTEKKTLEEKGLLDRVLVTNSHEDSEALLRSWQALQTWKQETNSAEATAEVLSAS